MSRSLGESILLVHHHSLPQQSPNRVLKFSAMKIFDKFRKFVLRFVFSPLPSSSSETSRRSQPLASGSGCTWRRSCDGPDPPKSSFSSTSYNYNYSSDSHYTEAIADCIEFLNKSSKDGCLENDASLMV